MALVKCINCGADISDKAEMCPKCQCNIRVLQQKIESTKELFWEAQGLYENQKFVEALLVIAKSRTIAMASELKQLRSKVMLDLLQKVNDYTDTDTKAIIALLNLLKREWKTLFPDPQLEKITEICIEKMAKNYIAKASILLKTKQTKQVEELIVKCQKLGYKSDELNKIIARNKQISKDKNKKIFIIILLIVLVVMISVVGTAYYNKIYLP